MTITNYVRDWFERGDEDLETAKILLEAKGVPNQICFHSRYPDDYKKFTRADAEAAWEAATRVKDFVWEKIT